MVAQERSGSNHPSNEKRRNAALNKACVTEFFLDLTRRPGVVSRPIEKAAPVPTPPEK